LGNGSLTFLETSVSEGKRRDATWTAMAGRPFPYPLAEGREGKKRSGRWSPCRGSAIILIYPRGDRKRGKDLAVFTLYASGPSVAFYV